jgi:hypothetical protein
MHAYDTIANQVGATGEFFERDGERWYQIDAYDAMPAFFLALTSDSDIWAFISTNGSLAAGRRDSEQSFLPYETVDKIHSRWETTGPRTWIRCGAGVEKSLWEPFSRRPGWIGGHRTIAKNLTGTRVRFEEVHPDGNLCFSQEWSSSSTLGLIRKLSLRALKHVVHVSVLDGIFNLIPPGENNATYNAMSALADAYKWSESHHDGRLALYTMYAQLWDRAEPKESFNALAAWHCGLVDSKTLLSSRQVENFCRGKAVEAETLTRGERGAFLQNFELEIGLTATTWYQVIDSPLSQAKSADLLARLQSGWGTPSEIEAAIAANTQGLNELIGKADGLQSSAIEMSSFHHTANVIFNIMRGGVFANGTLWETADLRSFMCQRNRSLTNVVDALLAGLPRVVERTTVLNAARAHGPQLERLVREYLPLTYSRRHGDPSRPWNKFSIQVRDENGQRVLNHQGNWRDIFQNWEALLWSHPEYVGSMISTFLSAMTPDGYNPYRITRDGIEWETVEEDDPWSFVGYWGDHQVVYLLKFLEAAQAFEPGLLAELWHRQVFSFANVPYRLKPYADIVRNPKFTIDFDQASHDAAVEAFATLGGDGKLVRDRSGQPVLGSLAEKLIVIILSKLGNLVPGGGIWLNTQRPEWNDANNALVGNGLSLVTLGSVRRLLKFLETLPMTDDALELPRETATAVEQLSTLVNECSISACTDPELRRQWLDNAGEILEQWRTALYAGWAQRTTATLPAGAFRNLVNALLPLVESTLRLNRRSDGLYHSYNLLNLMPGRAEINYLYPMLEGQVSMLSSGMLDAHEALSLGAALKQSSLFDAERKSFLLYPDRQLEGFLERNLLDETALAAAPIQRLLATDSREIFQRQHDGKIRFASTLANRFDVEQALSDTRKFGLSESEVGMIGDTYDRLLRHREFTGRSGTMFGYEGLGCIYWHMVAKLLLAVQEVIVACVDENAATELKALYRDIRAGLGYMKTPTEYGAFPFDPYSHTPAGGGAQQPGMTGQVKEEILTRWGELGIRWEHGDLFINPTIFDVDEIPPGGSLTATYRQIPLTFRRHEHSAVRAKTSRGWEICVDGKLPREDLQAVEVLV